MSSRVYAVPVAILIIGGVLISSNQVLAQTRCERQMTDVSLECDDYILDPGQQVSPSAECCVVMQKVGVPCLCTYVTEGFEYLVQVAQNCGKRFTPGSICGSITIPYASK